MAKREKTRLVQTLGCDVMLYAIWKSIREYWAFVSWRCFLGIWEGDFVAYPYFNALFTTQGMCLNMGTLTLHFKYTHSVHLFYTYYCSWPPCLSWTDLRGKPSQFRWTYIFSLPKTPLIHHGSTLSLTKAHYSLVDFQTAYSMTSHHLDRKNPDFYFWCPTNTLGTNTPISHQSAVWYNLQY